MLLEKLDFNELTEKINNAFFRLECYMNGSLNNYKYFGFKEAFTRFFVEAKKSENYTYQNCKLIEDYWSITEQIRYDYDKADFENTQAYENDMFCKDCEEIMFVNWDLIDEIAAFTTQDEIEELNTKFSITSILKSREGLSQNFSENQNRTEQFIRESFRIFDRKGWEYAFKTEKDYILFVNLLTNFFEKNAYSLPESAIALKRTCKTKVANLLGEIHKELAENPLRSDSAFHEIVRCLNHFEKASDYDLVKAMQR